MLPQVRIDRGRKPLATSDDHLRILQQFGFNDSARGMSRQELIKYLAVSAHIGGGPHSKIVVMEVVTHRRKARGCFDAAADGGGVSAQWQ